MPYPVSVCVRIRGDTGDGPQPISILDNGALEVVRSDDKRNLQVKSMFRFKQIFPAKTPQEEVSRHCINHIIRNIKHWRSSTVVSYGQTASGKTYTLFGNQAADTDPKADSRGLVQRLLELLCSCRKETIDGLGPFTIYMSSAELYNDKIYDVLASHKGKGLQLRGTPTTGVYIENLLFITISSLEEAYSAINKISANRHKGRTVYNTNSSRSHLVLNVVLQDGDKSCSINIVDLAGSELLQTSPTPSADKTQVSATIEETQFINSSLTALRKVILSLTNHSKYVPFRDSKLTMLLSNSLNDCEANGVVQQQKYVLESIASPGGPSSAAKDSCRLCLVICINDSPSCLGETIRALNFGGKAASIDRVAINKPSQLARGPATSSLIAQKNIEIHKLKMELVVTKKELKTLKQRYSKAVETQVEPQRTASRFTIQVQREELQRHKEREQEWNAEKKQLLNELSKLKATNIGLKRIIKKEKKMRQLETRSASAFITQGQMDMPSAPVNKAKSLNLGKADDYKPPVLVRKRAKGATRIPRVPQTSLINHASSPFVTQAVNELESLTCLLK